MIGIAGRKVIAWSGRTITSLKESNRGQWKWLESKKVPLASLNRNLWRSAESTNNYYWLLFLSGAIATFGLLSNSSATVIGAMIVAPLMGPIEGLSFGMVMANRRLVKRATLSLILGSLLTILTAALLTNLSGIETMTREISARTQPTLLDLGVALAAGGAGALAKSRRGIADALPGVAIAVALVPPLSVIGVGVAFMSAPVFFGASLLFLTNLAGIILSGALVFLSHQYGSIERARKGLVYSSTALLCLGIPLTFSFQNLVLKNDAKVNATRIINRSPDFEQAEIQSVSVRKQGENTTVFLDIEAQPQSIDQAMIDRVRQQLSDELERPIDLNVNIIPIETYTSESP